MTYLADLTPYTYGMYGGSEPKTLAVGWLEGREPFPQGEVPSATLDRLWAYAQAARAYPSLSYRGWHTCTICDRTATTQQYTHHDAEAWLGSGEIRVFGPGGQVYAAPNLIFHYVRDHDYQPPTVFLSALLDGLAPGSEAYDTAMALLDIARHLNLLGVVPDNLRLKPEDRESVRRSMAAFVRRTVEPLRETLRQRGIDTSEPDYGV